jgi:hypothetical protein
LEEIVNEFKLKEFKRFFITIIKSLAKKL